MKISELEKELATKRKLLGDVNISFTKIDEDGYIYGDCEIEFYFDYKNWELKIKI